MKKYFELHYSGNEYDPLQRRNNAELHYILGGNKVAAPGKAGGINNSASLSGGPSAAKAA